MLNKRQHLKIAEQPNVYSLNVSFYDKPPTQTYKFEELKKVTIERFTLLKVLEKATKNFEPYTPKWMEMVKEYSRSNNLDKFLLLMDSSRVVKATQLSEARRADHVSHYALMGCCCRNQNMKLWFLEHEIKWFHMRFHSMSDQQIQEFLRLNNVKIEQLTGDEKTTLRNELSIGTANFKEELVDACDFYRIHFTKVFKLLVKVKVYLKNGLAHVPTKLLPYCLETIFKEKLENNLTAAVQEMSTRHGTIFKYFQEDFYEAFCTDSFRKLNLLVEPNNIDRLSKHFPLCMKTLHNLLRRKHHLRYFSRLQYGLFLKDIGLGLENAIQFFEDEFMNSMTRKECNKHIYNINHQYGMVGQKREYPAHNCDQIIAVDLGPLDCHGCPFKHWDLDELVQEMRCNDLSDTEISDVVQSVQGLKYREACGKFFECTNHETPVEEICHPVRYFGEAFAVSQGRVDCFANEEDEM